jgi:phosphoadenosine phosphosulfate reductase
VVTGVRAQESQKRRYRGVYEACYRDDTRHFLNPIVDWTVQDVWAFIEERQLPYCELYRQGFKRLGCILCPNNGPIATRKHLARWPKIAEAWRRAGIRSWERGTDGMKKYPTGETYWKWWLTRTCQPKVNDAPTLFTM